MVHAQMTLEVRAQMTPYPYLDGGFKDFLFSPLLGEDSHFDYIMFFKGVETTNKNSYT